ncbi:MAG: hypothetical protein PHF84_10290 [bacterium]|nr:hypothetical protein [bacterium]
MELQQEFKELLKLFNAHNVEYVIVGAYALAFYGAPRYTGDIDILVRPDSGNARKVLAALGDFGFGSLGLKEEDFSLPEKVVQLGVSPVRIDLLTSLTGVTWEQIAAHCVRGAYGDVEAGFIGKHEFILNKKSLARHKDLADVEALGEQPD